VEFLASVELEGRAAPGRGSEIAGRYIATRFRQYELQEFESTPGYYQRVPLVTAHTDYEKTMITMTAAGITKKLLANRDFYFFPRGGHDQDISSAVLLCGYGIEAPEFNYDDYVGANPGGKIVLVFDGEPQAEDGNSLLTERKPGKYSRAVVKARIAQEKGAVALIILPAPNRDNPPLEKTLSRRIARMHDPIIQLSGQTEDFPVFYLASLAVAPWINDYIDLAGYQTGIDSKLKGNPKLLKDLKLNINIRFKDTHELFTSNVISYLPGKSEEAVLIMAHHDHEGTRDGQIFFGADDNASGVAGLLGIAKAFNLGQKELNRTVVFLSTGAEERGYLGAQYFMENPPLPLKNIVAVLNMDGIGRNGSSQFRAMMDPSIPGEEDLLMIFYSGQCPELADIADKSNKSIDLDLMLEPVLTFHSSSDHVPFHQSEIPSLFLFTGFHNDYHTPRDTPDKIIFSKLARVVELAYKISYNIAEVRERPRFDHSITEVERKGRYGE
jgi:hypothetical protein